MRYEFKIIPHGSAPVQEPLQNDEEVEEQDIELGGYKAQKKLARTMKRVMRRHVHNRYSELQN